MIADFASKLKDMLETARRESREELRFALCMVADVIVETLDSEPRVLEIDRRSASEAVAAARAAATVVDACHLVEHWLFSDSIERRFKELRLPKSRDRDALRKFLEQDIRGVAEGRPFIYAISTRDPEHHLYVGEGKSLESGARNPALKDGGQVFDAWQHGHALTLMLPSLSGAVTICDVAAAVLTVLQSRKALPRINGGAKGGQSAVGAMYLSEIGALFGELADQLQLDLGDPASRSAKLL